MSISDGLTFAVLGDWGVANGAQQRIINSINSFMGDSFNPTFIASVGDNFYPDGIKNIKDPLIENIIQKPFQHANYIKNIPFHPICGNHDWHGSVKAQIDLTKNRNKLNVNWTFPSLFYSRVDEFFHNESSYKVVSLFIDTNLYVDWRTLKHPDIENLQKIQTEWFTKNIAAAAPYADYIFVFGHHPVFSAGYHGSEVKLQEIFLPLFEKYGVDAYFTGHDHSIQILKNSSYNTKPQDHAVITRSGQLMTFQKYLRHMYLDNLRAHRAGFPEDGFNPLHALDYRTCHGEAATPANNGQQSNEAEEASADAETYTPLPIVESTDTELLQFLRTHPVASNSHVSDYSYDNEALEYMNMQCTLGASTVSNAEYDARVHNFLLVATADLSSARRYGREELSKIYYDAQVNLLGDVCPRDVWRPYFDIKDDIELDEQHGRPSDPPGTECYVDIDSYDSDGEISDDSEKFLREGAPENFSVLHELRSEWKEMEQRWTESNIPISPKSKFQHQMQSHTTYYVVGSSGMRERADLKPTRQLRVAATMFGYSGVTVMSDKFLVESRGTHNDVIFSTSQGRHAQRDCIRIAAALAEMGETVEENQTLSPELCAKLMDEEQELLVYLKEASKDYLEKRLQIAYDASKFNLGDWQVNHTTASRAARKYPPRQNPKTADTTTTSSAENIRV